MRSSRLDIPPESGAQSVGAELPLVVEGVAQGKEDGNIDHVDDRLINILLFVLVVLVMTVGYVG